MADKGKLLKPPADAAGEGPAPLQATEADNGKTVQAAVGQKIVVALDGNITTGYSWAVAKVAGEAISQIGKVEYAQRPAPRGMVGVGGQFKASFQAAKPGQATLTMEYRRPWEKNKPAEKTFTLTVQVQAAGAAEQGEQGVQGRVLKLTGNFMPSIGGPPGGKTQPLAVPVHIFKGSLRPLAKPDPKHPALVTIVQADKDGRYRAALPPGTYTVVAEIDGKLYLNLFLGEGTWGTVKVEKGKWIAWDIKDTSDAAF